MTNKYNVVNEAILKKMADALLGYEFLPSQFPIYIGIKDTDGIIDYFRVTDDTPQEERFKLFMSKDTDDSDNNEFIYVMSASNNLDPVNNPHITPSKHIICSSDSWIEVVYSVYWFLLDYNLIDDVYNLK